MKQFYNYTFRGFNYNIISVRAQNKNNALTKIVNVIKQNLPKYTAYLKNLDQDKLVKHLKNNTTRTYYKPKNILTDIRLTCGVFIINTTYNEVLVGRVTGSKDNRWDIPKGQIDDNETFEDAAIREAFEETNVDLDMVIRNSNCVFRELPYQYYNKHKQGVSELRTVAKYFVLETDYDFSTTNLVCDSTFTDKITGEEKPEFDIVKFVKLDELPAIHYSQFKALRELKYIQ